MGGTGGDLGKTLQAVACAQQINLMVHLDKKRKKKDRSLMVLLSGGTNAETYQLAKMAKVTFHGVSIGTYARAQIKEYIEAPNFFENHELIAKAVKAATALVDASVAENMNIVAA